jgi:hypothetical protein
MFRYKIIEPNKTGNEGPEIDKKHLVVPILIIMAFLSILIYFLMEYLRN